MCYSSQMFHVKHSEKGKKMEQAPPLYKSIAYSVVTNSYYATYDRVEWFPITQEAVDAHYAYYDNNARNTR